MAILNNMSAISWCQLHWLGKPSSTPTVSHACEKYDPWRTGNHWHTLFIIKLWHMSISFHF